MQMTFGQQTAHVVTNSNNVQYKCTSRVNYSRKKLNEARETKTESKLFDKGVEQLDR